MEDQAATIAAAVTFLARFGMFFGGSRDDDREGGGILRPGAIPNVRIIRLTFQADRLDGDL